MITDTKMMLGRKLLRSGILLFLLGLLTGFVIPLMENPRLGLSSHLEGVQNGMFLILLGFIWPKLSLGHGTIKWAYGLVLFGTFTNWFTTLLAGVWGAGGEIMAIAGMGMTGTDLQEVLIKAGLFSLSFAMLIVSGLVLWGLRGNPVEDQAVVAG